MSRHRARCLESDKGCFQWCVPGGRITLHDKHHIKLEVQSSTTLNGGRKTYSTDTHAHAHTWMRANQVPVMPRTINRWTHVGVRVRLHSTGILSSLQSGYFTNEKEVLGEEPPRKDREKYEPVRSRFPGGAVMLAFDPRRRRTESHVVEDHTCRASLLPSLWGRFVPLFAWASMPRCRCARRRR